MIPTMYYKEKDDENIRDLKKINFSEANIWERKHLQNWILEKPEILGEKLLIVTSEFDQFDKDVKNRLDILAIDGKGKLVVIELKRDIANEFVDLQAIHYAAYCRTIKMEEIVEMMKKFYEARSWKKPESFEQEIRNFIENNEFQEFDDKPRIILAANEFKNKTISAVLWLNEFDVDITCVKLDCYKLEDNNKIFIKPEIMIPLPEAKDYIIKIREKRDEVEKKSIIMKEYQEFWEKIITEFKMKKPNLVRRQLNTRNFYRISTGIRDVHFEWNLAKQREPNGFLVALHFETSDSKLNKDLFDYFEKQKDELQKNFNEEIIFNGEWNLKNYEICIVNENLELDDENVKWGVKTMLKFYDVFKPFLDNYFQENKN